MDPAATPAPRIVERKRIYSGWNRLDLLTVEATDADGGLQHHRRELIEHGSAAAVLVIDRKRDVAILARQWRTGLLDAGADPYLLEASAGIIDPGETPEQAARREAEEELGVKVGALRKIGSILPSAGTLTERIHLFVAEISGADLQARGGNAHEGEDIEIVEIPLPELYEMASRGAIEDAKTLVIVQRLMLEDLRSAKTR